MHPRANVLGLLMKDNCILLEERYGKHSKGTGYYYRPIGGTIEFGEHSTETLVREFQEELGVEIVINQYITCIENIFTIEGNTGHEITQVYVVIFKDERYYEQERFLVSEGEMQTSAKWVLIEEALSGEKVVYPTSLVERCKHIYF
ncbi:NUDIX hydrolase [Priestia taiwanensis]|uniref:DNA mismatch repair protein MutT n=1 Tax=Priestia taiwanensis TaxID=1347902 RepID=A0A917AWS8_9BACI|nr:NUDIX domain-containing protein [Priestia taiwanensis]MBM7364648.1 8-oxo-dGTP pyrophosphatase MutT (NUDIX family) [Priestia taiwanensis]GGE78518.1 DNA mismatch repair protein MutT [Priestia taiwanensis]